MPGLQLLSVLALAACLTGCGAGEPAAVPRDGEGQSILKRGNGGDPGSLDPALAEDLHAFNVLLDLYEGLLTVATDGSIVPGVAESWSVSPDGREYRFRLRADARWTNGERVTAAHFVHGFRHAVRQGSGAPNSFLLAPIANFQPVLDGERPPEALGIRAEGDDEVVIELDRPAAWFATVLTMPIALPRLPGVHDDAATYSDPDRFVGNGPYRLEERSPGGVIRLRRSATYHAAESVAFESVHFVPVTDPAAEFRLYRAGELDVTATIAPSEFAALQKNRMDEVQVTPGLGLYYLAFDLSEPPFNDPKLRRAFSLAIDRERLVAMLGRGELPAFGLVPPGVRSHDPFLPGWRDADRVTREQLSREALAASAYRGGKAQVIRLAYDAGDVHQKVALALRSMWQEVLGVEVSLQQMEWKAFLDMRNDRAAWQVMRFVWVGDYDDASSFTDLFVSGGPQNLPGYANPRYDELLARASVRGDDPERRQLLHSAEQMLVDDHAIVPLYFMTNKHLVSGRITGFVPNALDRHPSRYIRPRDGHVLLE
jgi:oligopeptide transport system substrate-binding protein